MLLVGQQEGHPACKNLTPAISKGFVGANPAYPTVNIDNRLAKQQWKDRRMCDRNSKWPIKKLSSNNPQRSSLWGYSVME